jgi:long-chain acyl-CoA synthetase
MNSSEPIRRNARIAPDAPAVLRVDGSTVSYAVLERTVDALSHRLRDLALVPGEKAAILTTDWYRYLVASLALARVGVAAAPTALMDVAIADSAEDTDGHPRVVFFRNLWPDDLLDGGELPPVEIDADDSAILAYCASSGTTTGMPKIIALSHRLMMRRIAIRAVSPPEIAAGRQTCLVGPGSVFGLGRMLRTLWAGGVVVLPNFKAEQLASWLVSSRVRHMAVSPIGLRKILEFLPREGVRCALETIEVGGGALPRATRELAQQRLPARLIVTYGSTETGPVAAAPLEAMLGRSGAVGYPFPGVDVEIVDADDGPLDRGTEGILRVRSGHAANGYVGNDAASASVFRGGWVYPNDRAIVEHDGLLRVLGRTDDVINRGGAKLNPEAIEEVMMTLADLREVAVFGAPDGKGDIVICAAFVPNVRVAAADFHARCREQLGAQAPAFIMEMRQLPRNAMGKVLRNELARVAVAAGHRDEQERLRAPHSQTQH